MKPATSRPPQARKGSRTRQQIVRVAADLFNTHGFAGTSVSDVSAATGLEKGGVYNHFPTKDALALAAFDYAAALVKDRLAAATAGESGGIARLAGLFEVYASLSEQPFLAGGCPILNTAVDADDTHPALRDRVRAAMSGWIALVRECLEAASVAGELRPDLDHQAVAAAIVAAIEGGVLLARLYADPAWMRRVIDQLRTYVELLRRSPDGPPG